MTVYQRKGRQRGYKGHVLNIAQSRVLAHMQSLLMEGSNQGRRPPAYALSTAKQRACAPRTPLAIEYSSSTVVHDFTTPTPLVHVATVYKIKSRGDYRNLPLTATGKVSLKAVCLSVYSDNSHGILWAMGRTAMPQQ